MQIICVAFPITNHLMSWELDIAEEKLPLRCQGDIVPVRNLEIRGIKNKRNLHTKASPKRLFHPSFGRVMLQAQPVPTIFFLD